MNNRVLFDVFGLNLSQRRGMFQNITTRKNVKPMTESLVNGIELKWAEESNQSTTGPVMGQQMRAESS